jgi:two-component system, LytTR family, sensor kinase
LINENTELAENYAVKLSNFLRYSVDSHKAELVSLKEELQFANDYIELQKVRFENSFSFSENIPKEAMSLKIPVFALQTLIENVFKHNQLTEKNPLTIKVKYADKKLEIWNNKIPLKLVDKTNTGLQNLARRYQLSTNETIEIADLEHSFCVTIKLIEA